MRFIILMSILCAVCCGMPKNDYREDFTKPEKTLALFFHAGHDGNISVVSECFSDWKSIVDHSPSYRKFIEQIRAETENLNYRVFKVDKKEKNLELGVEIFSEHPYFSRRDFYSFDYRNGKWLIVTSGWMKDMGCG